jgi:hypothetical protein
LSRYEFREPEQGDGLADFRGQERILMQHALLQKFRKAAKKALENLHRELMHLNPSAHAPAEL